LTYLLKETTTLESKTTKKRGQLGLDGLGGKIAIFFTEFGVARDCTDFAGQRKNRRTFVEGNTFTSSPIGVLIAG